MNKLWLTLGPLLCAVALPAFADVSALVAIEPTARKDGLMLSRSALEAGLSKALDQAVLVTSTEDLTDAMRSTRSAGYDVFIGPAQVVASAMAHGYELIGSTDAEEQYLLVGKPALKSVADLRGGRLYLPQQDSLYTYLARGLLTAGGLSFKDLGQVEHAHYPQAGLTAIDLHLSDATVVRRDDWERWQKEQPNAARVLATSGWVPGGFSVAVRKDLAPATRLQIAKWFSTSAGVGGMKPLSQHADLMHYQQVAELGTFTLVQLSGAEVVTAIEVQRLITQGVTVVDTRTEKEFKQKHIAQAIFLPYHEKSPKDVVYDAALDDFPGLKTLDAQKPVVFHCNGAECWKSYKASRAAIAAGFKTVYWYRGGMPDWEKSGQSVVKQ